MFDFLHDVENIEQVKKAFQTFNNNDGGIVIKINESDRPSSKRSRIKIGFLLEYDEVKEDKFKEFVPISEYFDYVGNQYISPNFREMFMRFCASLNIEVIGDKQDIEYNYFRKVCGLID